MSCRVIFYLGYFYTRVSFALRFSMMLMEGVECRSWNSRAHSSSWPHSTLFLMCNQQTVPITFWNVEVGTNRSLVGILI